MNEPTPTPPPKPYFFTSSFFTLFISSENELWIYGARIISVSKHTPRIKVSLLSPLEKAPKFYTKARLPVNGADNGKGYFSRYSNGYAVDILVDGSRTPISDPYIKQKIEEHYTYNYPPTTTQTP